MIKLKSLLSLNEHRKIPVVVGIIDSNGGISSSLEKTGRSHGMLGFHFGLKWRYNPETQFVYWPSSNHSEQSEEDMFNVEEHLRKKYNFKVTRHIDMSSSEHLLSIKQIDNAHGIMSENVNDNTPAHQFIKKYYSDWPVPVEAAKIYRKTHNYEKESDTALKDKQSLRRTLYRQESNLDLYQEMYYEAIKKFNDALKKHSLSVVEVGWGLDLKNAFEKYYEETVKYLAQFPSEVDFGLNEKI